MSPKHLLILVLVFVAASLSLIAFARTTGAASPLPSVSTQFVLPLERPPASVLL